MACSVINDSNRQYARSKKLPAEFPKILGNDITLS